MRLDFAGDFAASPGRPGQLKSGRMEQIDSSTTTHPSAAVASSTMKLSTSFFAVLTAAAGVIGQNVGDGNIYLHHAIEILH